MTVEEIKERNIENVLHEATRLFAQTGAERTSMEMIATAAHVTRRSVLNYFPSKDALIRAVLDRSMRAVGEDMAAYLDSKEYLALSGLEQFVGILRYFFNLLSTQHDYINSMTEMAMALRRSPDKSLHLDYSLIVTRVERSLYPAYEKGLRDGSIRPDASLRREQLGVVSLTLRGLFRQMAFLMQSNSPEEADFVKRFSDDYIAIVRTALAIPMPKPEV